MRYMAIGQALVNLNWTHNYAGIYKPMVLLDCELAALGNTNITISLGSV